VSEFLAPEEVKAFVRGELPEERLREVAAWLGLIAGVRRSPNEPPSGSDAAYDAAIDRALAVVRRERSRGKALLSRLETEGIDRVLDSGRKLRGSVDYEILLERCQAVRYDDADEMLKLASCAAIVAEKLSEKKYGSKQVRDYRCRALIEVGNAYRVKDRLRDAEEALARAARLFLEGSRDEMLEARLFDVQASLFADTRRFDSAREALDTVEAIYRRRGDLHLAGRALLSKGLYATYGDRPEEAIVFLTEGLSLIDRGRAPELVFSAVHNLARALTMCGLYREARAMLFPVRGREEEAGGRVNYLKVRWLEAEIAVGLDELERAELGFASVRDGFREMDLPYKAALAALELSEVHLHQKRAEDAKEVALEAIAVFLKLGIPREVLTSILVLQRAFEMGVAQGALLRTVINFLKKAESDPSLRFEDWIEKDDGRFRPV
jgi:tetratricopeptide (TPR) repeat protein